MAEWNPQTVSDELYEKGQDNWDENDWRANEYLRNVQHFADRYVFERVPADY